MHYEERASDGTVLGLFDGTHNVRAMSTAQFWAHHEAVARSEHPLTRGHTFPSSSDQFPLRAIEHARIRTALITTYRIHTARYLFSGADFPKTWVPRPEKLQAPERYSPPGTLGYYFGLTLDAAFDEASFYAGKDLEHEPDDSKIILVHRTHYTDLLYLASVLPAVWEHLHLPEIPIWEMYISIMAPITNNNIANTIGLWARDVGFRGIIFPSARYGQRVDLARQKSASLRFPVLNFVNVGSHLCEQGIAMRMTLQALIGGLAPHDEPPAIVYSEPNLVVFDQEAVAGIDRPVFYTSYRLSEAAILRERDERSQLKHGIQYFRDGAKVALLVDGPGGMHFLESPK